MTCTSYLEQLPKNLLIIEINCTCLIWRGVELVQHLSASTVRLVPSAELLKVCQCLDFSHPISRHVPYFSVILALRVLGIRSSVLCRCHHLRLAPDRTIKLVIQSSVLLCFNVRNEHVRQSHAGGCQSHGLHYTSLKCLWSGG